MSDMYYLLLGTCGYGGSRVVVIPLPLFTSGLEEVFSETHIEISEAEGIRTPDLRRAKAALGVSRSSTGNVGRWRRVALSGRIWRFSSRPTTGCDDTS